MAFVTFLKWAALLPFLCQCLVTGLAVLMIGILQLHGLALFLNLKSRSNEERLFYFVTVIKAFSPITSPHAILFKL